MAKTTENEPMSGPGDQPFKDSLAAAGLDLPADMHAGVQRAAMALRHAVELLLAYLPPDAGVARKDKGS